MSKRDGHARGGGIAPNGQAAAAGALRLPAPPLQFDETLPTLPQDEQRFLDLDGKQGHSSADHESIRTVIEKARDGKLPDVPLVEPISPIDSALDPAQRDAVARALQAADLHLIFGPVGTGKTRVAVEIVRQTANRNGRVLFLSPTPVALDSVLPALAGTMAVARRLGPGELPGQLPAEVAAHVAANRRVAARTNLLRKSNEDEKRADARLHRAKLLQSTWSKLAAVRDRHGGHVLEREALAVRRESVLAEVRREAEAHNDPAPYFVQRLNGIAAAHARRMAALDVAGRDIQTLRAAAQSKLDAAETDVRNLRPKADALQNGRWYTLTFWRAKSDGTLGERLRQAEGRLAAARTELDEIGVREQKLAADRKIADDELHAERARLLDVEASKRRVDMDVRIAELDREIAADAAVEAGLVSQFAGSGIDLVRGAHAIADELTQAEREFESARSWAAEVATRLDELVEKACAAVAVVVGPVAGIATDAEVISAGNFDLLVIDDAHRLSEADFMAAAALARRWVLVGETVESMGGRARAAQPGFFAKLGAVLRHETWVRDGAHLTCRLYPVRGADRRRLECEPVADAPDIELRLFTPPDGTPSLAEVVFPASTPPSVAREYLFREMGEVTCAPRLRTIAWEASDEGPIARFAPADPLATFADIGVGIREELLDLETRAIHFAHYWTTDEAKGWVAEYVGARDAGRVVTLSKPQRACPGLACWLNRAFDVGFTLPAAADDIAHVEFLAVPDIDPRRRRETSGRPGRTGGAGYEIDLADSRQRAALPADCTLLPTNGVVNFTEAQTIARYLEPLARAGIAVTSPFPAQVALIRHLFAKSPRLAGLRVLDAREAANHECEILVVSLTRSHVARAVTFGEGPAILAGLLGRARKKVLFAGDPGTLARRLQWEGPVDHLDAIEAARERAWVAALADCPRVSPPRHRPSHFENVRA